MKHVFRIIGMMFFLCLAVITPSLAQTDSVVELVKDPRIDLLIKKQAQINKVSAFKNSTGQYKGYRLLVLNTNNRDLAYKTRTQLLRIFPNDNVYMAYQSPYFKLKLGDYVKKEDAAKMKKQVSAALKQDVFVVPDIIKLSAEDEARLLKEAGAN